MYILVILAVYFLTTTIYMEFLKQTGKVNKSQNIGYITIVVGFIIVGVLFINLLYKTAVLFL